MANHRYLAVVLPSILARWIGTLRMKGTGYQTRIPLILKNRWHNAIWRLLSSLSPELARAARRPVAVVPMFEPSVSGNILSSLITPRPTRGVMADVKTELLCTMKVMPAPTMMAKTPVNCLKGPGRSEFMVFWMIPAIRPLRQEWRSLTIKTRQVHSMMRDRRSKRPPTALSDKPASAIYLNKYSPARQIEK